MARSRLLSPLVFAFLTGAPAAGPSLAVAQASLAQVPDPELQAVDALVREGESDDARNRLSSWFQARPTNVDPASLEWALWLRGRLALDPAAATEDYLLLIRDFPEGRFANASRMRLARAAEAMGDGAVAAAWMKAVLAAHPDPEAEAEAEMWLTEHSGVGSAASPNPAPSPNSPNPPNPPNPPSELDDALPEAPAAPAAAPPDLATAAVDVTPEADGPYTVQLGAYLTDVRALRMIERAGERGFEARLVKVPGSPLFRVRVGRFAQRSGAQALADSVAAAGFATFVTDDTHRERPVG